MGYDKLDEITVTRQINIGGRNKYLINGVNVQNHKVGDFFQRTVFLILFYKNFPKKEQIGSFQNV